MTACRMRAVVYGRVQGVNFRYYTIREAQPLALDGFVRNRRDGTVEVVAEGRREQLERLLEFLRVGPASAAVRDVQVEWTEAKGDLSAFTVAY